MRNGSFLLCGIEFVNDTRACTSEKRKARKAMWTEAITLPGLWEFLGGKAWQGVIAGSERNEPR
jgi:hypothetical protein